MYSHASELGIYFNDTRFIGVWEMTFNGAAPVSLAKELRFSGNTAVFSMTNPDLPRLGESGRIRRDTFLIRRILTLQEDTFYETVEVKNFDDREHTLQVEQWVGSRFDDVFEVRGFPRPRRGKMLAAEESSKDGGLTTILQYEGLDAQIRRTFIHRLFPAEKIRVSPSLTGHFTRISIPSKSTVALKTIVSFDKPSEGKLMGRPYAQISVPEKMEILARDYLVNPLLGLSIITDNALVNKSIENARRDIFTLLTREESGVLYPYAGIPWFSAPFGRDGLITAFQLLPWNSSLAQGVLQYVFETLGTKFDAFTDEQPGKAFHEMRRGEMSRTREVPFIPYYGSVDSTPLALILLHEYIRWTMDLGQLRKWWPFALRALDWIDTSADTNGDGFVGYAMQSTSGLVNQGWKDSGDSVMHRDGRLAEVPIRLCEAQGYAFRARMGMSALARLLGDDVLASRLRLDALKLRARFQEQFWNAEERFVHLALDGKSRPCAVRTSNMGHCLWAQILTGEQARDVAEHLLSDAMFSGFGIRTLADTETAYNPLSYHNGSVWPHDNSIIMEGLRLYGFQKELEKLALGTYAVLESSDDFRLPELFCGFRRRGSEPPVPYQVACKPQAWAAGSIFLMLKSMLGVSMETDQNYLVFNSPLLTDKISTMEIKGLQCRDWEADLILRRGRSGTTVEVTRKTGPLRVLTVKR